MPITIGPDPQRISRGPDRKGEWHLAAFRGKHRADADHAYLTWLDERASSAASRHPGFMYSFIGTSRADGSCLSFCLWHSREHAVAAAADPEHREAMLLGLPCFVHYVLERYHVIKERGALSCLPLPSTPSAAPVCRGRSGGTS